ncbi:sulfurtransferase TusA homolog [Striga asiatica]|uniref:Sulfurtransferase TusA homolog n=1 Tax=Striga asiatica TaxID=4170 RepID=A0A5A7QER2_STRAF|nr:sulfurtransferase TusA homolog [Striga asiatica]
MLVGQTGKDRFHSAPAPSDGAAASAVGVGLRPRPAVVVRRAAPRAGDAVPLQRAVADVPPAGQDAPSRLRFQRELLVLVLEALADGSPAAGYRRQPDRRLAVAAGRRLGG